MISPPPLRSSSLGPATPPSLFTSLGDRGCTRGEKPAAVEGHTVAGTANRAVGHPVAATENRDVGVAAGADEQAQGTESRKKADGSYSAPAAEMLE
uniref:Uncharacterized protein n=1 Tax=Aegilops tauschii subsp. strangulata TaxID=200361 RepID=A0A453NXA8_AEGTS